MKHVSDYFGSLAFDDRVMKARLSSEVYQSLKKPSTREQSWIFPLPMLWQQP